MPQSGMEAFNSGVSNAQNLMNLFMQQKFAPHQLNLLKAQAQEHQGKAAQSQMLMKLLQEIQQEGGTSGQQMDGGQQMPMPQQKGAMPQGQGQVFPESDYDKPLTPYQKRVQSYINEGDVDGISAGTAGNPGAGSQPQMGGTQEQQQPQMQQPKQQPRQQFQPTSRDNAKNQKANLAAALLGLPVHQTTVDGQLAVNNPLTGVQTYRIGLSPEETSDLKVSTQKRIEHVKHDAAIAAKYDEQAMAENGLGFTLESLQQTVNNPKWQQMRQFATIPYGGKAELAYYASQGTPEEKKLVGDFIANTGEIYSGMAQRFKGAFRKGEQGLIQGMKVNENDTFEVAQGKLEAMMKTNQFLEQRAIRMSNLIRQGFSAPQALEIAHKEQKGALFEKTMKENIKSLEKQNKQGKEASTGMITIIDSNGKEHSIHRSNLAAARKEDPGLRVKELE